MPGSPSVPGSCCIVIILLGCGVVFFCLLFLNLFMDFASASVLELTEAAAVSSNTAQKLGLQDPHWPKHVLM